MTVWTDFVKQYAKENNLSYKEAMKQAKLPYRNVKLNIIEDDELTPAQTNELTQNIQNIYKQNKQDTKLTKKQLDDPLSVLSPTDQTKVKNLVNNLKMPSVKEMLALLKNDPVEPQINKEVVPPTKKKKLKMPSPYRKVTLNIIEDDATEPPKIETIEEPIEEPIKPKKKKSRNVKLDIQGEYIPPIVSETEDELNKTPIPKLKEMLKELNFTKFAKFKKQDYVDKILELKNIPKGVWWNEKYPWLYKDLETMHRYLTNDSPYYNMKNQKYTLQKKMDKLEELKKSNLKGEHYRTQIKLIKNSIERIKEQIKEFDDLSNIDFEKEVEKLENEAADSDADRKKKIDEYFAKKETEPIPPSPSLDATVFGRYKNIGSPYQNIIDEWDTPSLTYILYQQQQKIYDAIEKKILTLAKKKSSVLIPDLLFFIKPFLNDLFVHYGSNKPALDIIQNGMADLVISMGYDEDKVFKDNTEYLGKHFNKTHKKIIYDIFK